MKCYLHIGTEKTGTSTIQEFFANNSERLQKKGFFYSRSLGVPNNRFLPLAAFNTSRRDDFTNKLNIFSDEALITFQKNILQNFKQEIERLAQDSIVICSSEHIQSRLTTQEEIERLKTILHEVGITDITVIVYLRNPSETANSLYSTAIKAGNTIPDVPPPDNQYFENICNHKNTIEKFASVFGKEKVIVRLFRKDKLFHRSLIHDISNIIGLNLEANDLIIPENKNESLSLLGLKILRNLNGKIPSFKADGQNHQRKDLVDFVTKYFSKPKFVMDEKLYQAYDSHFAQSNKWVQEHYFPEEEELFPYKPPTSKRMDISEDELQKITDFMADIWMSRSNALNNEWYIFGKKTSKQKIIAVCKYPFKRIKDMLKFK